jgi:hypothetical protein
MTPWIRQFSHPVETVREQVFDTIAAAHGVSVVLKLLELHGGTISRISTGLADSLASWTARPVSLETVWDIAFGRALLALKEGRLDIGDVATRLGVRLAEQGHAGSWAADVSATHFVIGRSLVRNATRVEVELRVPGEGMIAIHCAGGGCVRLTRSHDGSWCGDGGVLLRRAGTDLGFTLLPADALPNDAPTGAALKECLPVAGVTDAMQRVFEDGLRLLQDLAPAYVPWVTRVIHGVVVCSIDGPYHLVSGSWEDIPGLIHLSCPHVPVDMAETLVHEAAHQYFYMLERVGPIDDGSDTVLYWSPPIRMNRPLSRILMAFHALVNALQVYRAVRAANTPDTPYVLANEPALRGAIETLNRPLRENQALTALGRGLYGPLAELLEPSAA